MALTMITNVLKSFMNPGCVQATFVRNGHQMCTRNHAGRPIPKRRGIKRNQNASVFPGEILVTQRVLKFHPGMNVAIGRNLNLVAMVPGKVSITCEKFNPDFNNGRVIQFYKHREGQEIYKKYFNVIPFPLGEKFKLKEVV